MPRLPTRSDLTSSSLVTTITENPESQPPTNILILLHGLGDSEAPFTKLGTQLNLPHTCVLSIRAPKPLPFDLPGFHWGDDINLNTGSGALDPDAGFQRSTEAVLDGILRQVLLSKCEFRARDVVIWGFGQGGMLALALAKAAEEDRQGGGGGEMGEMGGVITVGGALPEEVAARAETEGRLRTPVIALGGSSGTALDDGQVERLRRVFEFVERVNWRRSGDGMPRDRGEMMPVMQFLARRLRAAAPDGAVEVAG